MESFLILQLIRYQSLNVNAIQDSGFKDSGKYSGRQRYTAVDSGSLLYKNEFN